MASSGQLASSVRHTHDESRRTAAVLVRFPHPAVDPVYVPHRLQRPNHKHRTRVSRWSVLDLYILPLVAVRPPVAFLLALLFKRVHRLADPRSTHPHTLATQLPRNAASPIQPLAVNSVPFVPDIPDPMPFTLLVPRSVTISPLKTADPVLESRVSSRSPAQYLATSRSYIALSFLPRPSLDRTVPQTHRS